MSASISLRDVAEKAGVSRSTASRALQQHPMVALKTRERVAAVAKELGYQPDPVVSGLMRTHRSSGKVQQGKTVIAWINELDDPEGWHKSLFRKSSWSAAEKRAAQLNAKLEELWLGQPGMHPARMEQIIHSRGIRGMILPDFRKDVEEYGFSFQGLATVLLRGHPQEKGGFSQILSDEFSNMIKAMNALHAQGYQRIALCISSFINWTSDERLVAAYRHAQQAFPAKNRLKPWILAGSDADVREQLLKRIHKEKPDGIITNWGETKDWLENAGLHIPEEIGIVSLNLTEHTAGWTGILQNQEAAASAAVDSVIAQLARFESGRISAAKRMLIEGSWVDGNTTR